MVLIFLIYSLCLPYMQIIVPTITNPMPTFVSRGKDFDLIWLNGFTQLIANILLDNLFSPRSVAETAVNRNVSELATGTATDRSASCSSITYSTLPHWLRINGSMYWKRKKTTKNILLNCFYICNCYYSKKKIKEEFKLIVFRGLRSSWCGGYINAKFNNFFFLGQHEYGNICLQYMRSQRRTK